MLAEHLAMAAALSGTSFAIGRLGITAARATIARLKEERDAALADARVQRQRLAIEMVNREAARFAVEVWRDRAMAIALGESIVPGRPTLRLVVSNDRGA